MNIVPNVPSHSIPKEWIIRPLADPDRAFVLQLNASSNPEVWPLSESDLNVLLAFGGHHLVAMAENGNVLGYLLSFPSTSSYDDPEIQQFRRLLPDPFIYICQVVIASQHRRRGIGRAFYDAIVEKAELTGVRALCCDVNVDPPNPISITFHRKLGFVQIGEGHASNGFAIALLAKKW